MLKVLIGALKAIRSGDSAALRLACILVVCSVAPLLLFSLHFGSFDRGRHATVDQALQVRDSHVAEMITPLLLPSGRPAVADLQSALGRYSRDTQRWILQVTGRPPDLGVVRIATVASITPGVEWSALFDDTTRLALLPRFQELCSREDNQLVQTTNTSRVSIQPIVTARGCWLLVSSDSLSALGEAGALKPTVLWVAVSAYIAGLAIAALNALKILAGMRHIRELAYNIRRLRRPQTVDGRPATMRELSAAAETLNSMSFDITRLSEQMRQTAEDNAHALKTPLAVLRSAIERVKRQAVPSEVSSRALTAASAAVDRMFLLVAASQRLDEDTASLLVAERHSVDLTQIVTGICGQFDEVASLRAVRLVRKISPGIRAQAGAGQLETIVRNVIDNALNCSPNGSTVFIRLSQDTSTITLRVEDEGNLPAATADRVFERDYAAVGLISSPGAPNRHVRPGLFIVKRNIEMLGGKAVAERKSSGGCSITLSLARRHR